MRFALFIPQKDFRDETVSLMKLILTKWNVPCDVASYGKRCIGMHGAVLRSDINPTEMTTIKYSGIILADGKGIDDQKLYDYRPLLDIVTRFNEAALSIIAVGNAAKILSRANIVKGKKIVVADEDTRRLTTLFYGVPSTNGIEESGNILTLKDAKAAENSAEQILQHIGVS